MARERTPVPGLSIPIAFFNPYVSIAMQIVVVLTWVIPDRRIESRVAR